MDSLKSRDRQNIMKILAKQRHEGKTYEAIMESQRTGAVIVCGSEKEAERVKRIARYELKIEIPDPISCYKASRDLMGKHQDVIIDNLEWILHNFIGPNNIHGITIDDTLIEWKNITNQITGFQKRKIRWK